MSNWHSIYHQALLGRLVSMTTFVVLGPVLWMLISTGFRLIRRSARFVGQSTLRQGHFS